MRMVERRYGQARRVWVFDRGIVSDANLAAIRRRGGQYLVGTRRSKLRAVEQALFAGPWTRVRDEVEAQLIPIPGGTETYVLCRSTARREKELAIRRRFSTHLEDRLRGLAHRVATGGRSICAKIERALVRLQLSTPVSPICTRWPSVTRTARCGSTGASSKTGAPGAMRAKGRTCCGPISWARPSKGSCGPSTSS